MARSCKAARIRARPQRCIGRSFANIGEEVFGEVAKKSDLVTMRCDGERESVAFGDEGIELLRTFELMKRSFASGAFPRENEGVEVRARPVLGLNSQTKKPGDLHRSGQSRLRHLLRSSSYWRFARMKMQEECVQPVTRCPLKEELSVNNVLA